VKVGAGKGRGLKEVLGERGRDYFQEGGAHRARKTDVQDARSRLGKSDHLHGERAETSGSHAKTSSTGSERTGPDRKVRLPANARCSDQTSPLLLLGAAKIASRNRKSFIGQKKKKLNPVSEVS